jgi:hypothetical protein
MLNRPSGEGSVTMSHKTDAQRPSMVENLRKAEFDAAQPVRNKEKGKIDYIVKVADHKTAESAPGVIYHTYQRRCLPQDSIYLPRSRWCCPAYVRTLISDTPFNIIVGHDIVLS